MSSFFRQNVQQAKPPDKGSFPLDRKGACKEFKEAFMACLRANGNDNAKCRLESKAYLECRMEKNLMAKEDWRRLGFGDVVQGQAGGSEGTGSGEAQTQTRQPER